MAGPAIRKGVDMRIMQFFEEDNGGLSSTRLIKLFIGLGFVAGTLSEELKTSV